MSGDQPQPQPQPPPFHVDVAIH